MLETILSTTQALTNSHPLHTISRVSLSFSFTSRRWHDGDWSPVFSWGKMFLTSFFARGTAWPSFSIWARLVAPVFEQCPGCTARRETSAARISHAVEDLDVWLHFPGDDGLIRCNVEGLHLVTLQRQFLKNMSLSSKTHPSVSLILKCSWIIHAICRHVSFLLLRSLLLNTDHRFEVCVDDLLEGTGNFQVKISKSPSAAIGFDVVRAAGPLAESFSPNSKPMPAPVWSQQWTHHSEHSFAKFHMR